MPSSAAAVTVRRTASAPRRWPAMRGRPRDFAQRPLPSMMMATCRGGGSGSAQWRARSWSDLKDLLVLLRQHVVDVLDRLIGERLDVVLQLALLVLARCLPSFSFFLRLSSPSRRTLRTETRAASAYFAATRVSSRRRSSLRSGIGTRMVWPSVCGLRPSPASRIALSAALARPRSHTWTTMRRGSGTLTVPT